MASSASRLFPDPEELLSRQIDHAIVFVHWADNARRLHNDDTTMQLLHEFASDCYALALRNMSDYLLAQLPTATDAARVAVELWMAQILELVETHDDLVAHGDLWREEARQHESELLLLARLDLSDEHYAVLQEGILRGYQLIAERRAKASNADPEKLY